MSRFNTSHDKLKALIDEAHLVLTDSDLDQLGPLDGSVDVDEARRRLRAVLNERSPTGARSTTSGRTLSCCRW